MTELLNTRAWWTGARALVVAAVVHLGTVAAAQDVPPTSLVLRPPFPLNGGHGYTAALPEAWPADDPDGDRSALALFEDGKPLGPGHTVHADVRALGGGRFSHWDGHLYFSSSDGSDPNTNGRTYTAEYRVALGELDYRPLVLGDPLGELAVRPTELPELPRGAPPVVYWYTIDALRADLLDAMHDGAPLLPTLSAFADEAVVFEQAYATSSFTKLSTASMFTGLWPTRHRVDHGHVDVWPRGRTLVFDLDRRFQTLAEAFTSQGYETWTHRYSVHTRAGDGMLAGFARLDLDTEARVPFTPGAERWFAYEHILGAHGPYDPSPGSRARIGVEVLAGFDPSSTNWFEAPLDEAQVATLWDSYRAEAVDADGQLARRLEWLRASGRWDDALVIVTSDHGEAFNEHGFTQHSTHLYEEGVRVPLLVKFPEGHPAATRHGERLPHRVSLVDLYPTLIELTGAPAPAYALDGRSLIPILRGDEDVLPPRLVVLRSSFTRSTPDGGQALMVVEALLSAHWKAHFGYRLQGSQDPDGHPFDLGGWVSELYDLDADPGETINRVDDQPQRFLDMLEAHAATRWLDRDSTSVPDLDEVTLERLRELGYLR